MTIPINRVFIRFCYAAAICIFVFGAWWFYYTPFVRDLAKTGNNGTQLSNLTNIGTYLHQYARTHDGKFPAKLADLSPSEMPPLALQKLQFYNPKTFKVSAWTYFPGYVQSDPPDLILAASPEAVESSDQKRKVRFTLFISGEVREVNDADYEVKITAQKALSNPNAR